MTPTEDLKHDIKVLVDCIEELVCDCPLEHSHAQLVKQAFANLHHKYSQDLVMA